MVLALLLISGGTAGGDHHERPPSEVADWRQAVALGDRILLEPQPPLQAEAYYRRALELVEAESGVEDFAVSLVLDRLGQAQAAQTKYEEAELSFLRSLRWRLVGKGHEAATAEILENLAALYYQMGKAGEGFAALEQSHRLRVDAFGADSAQAGRSFSRLAAAHHQEGDLGHAEDLYGRAVENLRPHASEPCDREELTIALVNLRLVLEEIGGEEQAGALEKEGLALPSSPECPPSLGESPWGGAKDP